ncbi:MAG: exodeoxyribonuclease VII large subunit [Pseudomonadales bacterium]|nr:exodeoxyribonuclease VII large subunit [Pseudomonadales bacterium]
MATRFDQPAEERPVYTVSALARAARLLIEEHFGLLWVEGEVSNFRRPGSGHWYFTLKDSDAQLRCAMFAGRNRALRREPRDGDRVIVRGRLSLYEPRGDFQFIAEHLEPAGEGALRAAFDALKARLAGEGLFDPARKRPLPAIPRRLAVISSPSGAALRDVLHVIARRFPVLEVVLLPVAVQGESAEPEILAALARVPATGADAVLLTRGGGSLEDLWTFNLETVARAVAACPLPTVAAIGHQTDFTIVDFVADVRAPTPSAGAELITPDRAELGVRFDSARNRLVRALTGELRQQHRHLAHLRARLVSPRTRLQQRMQRTDELEQRLIRAITGTRTRAAARLAGLRRALDLLHPGRLIERTSERVDTLEARLASAVQAQHRQRREALHGAVRTLQAISPLATLARGYAVLTDAAGGTELRPITSIRATAPGARLVAHLSDGALHVQVDAVDTDNGLPALPTTDGS